MGIPIIDLFYNTDVDRTKQEAYAAEAEMLNAMNEYVEKYPKFKNILAEEGLLNPDGSINAQKFIDKGYLNAIKNYMSEQTGKSYKRAVQTAIAQSALSGAPVLTGQGLKTLQKGMADTGRESAMQYGNIYKAESENAYNKAMTLAGKYQSDLINQYLAKIQAKQSKFQARAADAASQSKGILQDPDKFFELVKGVIDLGKNASKLM